MSVYDGTQPQCDRCGMFNCEVVCMDCVREMFEEIALEIRNKVFPIGERQWCKECADRIASYIKSDFEE